MVEQKLHTFYVHKFMPWKEILDIAIMRLWAAGFIEKLDRPDLPYDPDFNPNQRVEERTQRLDMDSFGVLFVLLAGGYVFAFVCFAIEFVRE